MIHTPHNPFDLIVFDWDGTLSDSTASIAQSLQLACADLNHPIPSDEQANHVIGLGLSDAMQYLLPELPPTQIAPLIDRYRHHFLTRVSQIALFDGVRELLTHLQEQGYILAIATGKSRRALDVVLDQSGLAHHFQTTRCADETHSKPHPAMLLEIMDKLFVEPERTLMIGDTTHDILMAHNAKTRAIAVTCGAHPAQLLHEHNPLASLTHTHELQNWLCEYTQSN